jgi:hypothetical protein
MIKDELLHAVFTVVLCCLVFRSAGDPVGVTVAAVASGLLVIALTNRFVHRHGPRS